MNLSLPYLTTLPDGRPNGSEILSSICPSAITQCDIPYNASALHSYREFWYEGNVTLPEKCGLWIFKRKGQTPNSWRDNEITNIEDSSWMYGEALLNNLDTSYKNNSVTYTSPIFRFSCAFEPNYFELGFEDADNDSVVITHIPTKTNGFNTFCPLTPHTDVSYKPPFTINEPFNTGGTWQFNPSNGGSISFTAPAPQIPILTFRTDEYRNGVWVGGSIRDMMYNVVNCSSPLPVRKIDTASFINVNILPNGEFKCCVDNTINLCTWFTVADTNAKLKIESNLATIIPAASLVSTGIGSDSMHTCMQWAPTINDTGTYTFRLVVTDTACSFPGVLSPQIYYYTLHVKKTVDTTTFMNAQACGQYIWNGQTYTASGMYAQTFNNTAGCDSISVLNLSMLFIDKSVVLSAFSLWSNAPGAQYQWINCDTKLPIAGATNQGYTTIVGGNYGVVINQFGCTDTSDCVKVFSVNTTEYIVSDKIDIYPNPANETITLALPTGTKSIEITMYNMLGEIVLSKNNSLLQDHTIDLSVRHLSKGLYTIQVVAGETRFIGKFVKE